MRLYIKNHKYIPPPDKLKYYEIVSDNQFPQLNRKDIKGNKFLIGVPKAKDILMPSIQEWLSENGINATMQEVNLENPNFDVLLWIIKETKKP